MPRCSRCAAEAPDSVSFCGRCGAALSSPTEAATVAMAAAQAASISSSSTPEEGRFASGTVLAQRYRISGKLGQGGMGEVYKATDLLLDQTVALKFLPEGLVANVAAAERFRNEVRLARQVSHPNVCRVYDMGEAEGELFLTMEYVDGEDLATLLRRIGRLPTDKATEIARRLCAGLAAAHEKGVLHRDFKPANIMIDGRGQVRITDFGLAALAGSAGERFRGGTPGYMAPEQIDGQAASERSDIYALGLVLFEMFAGKRPFEAPDLAAIHARQKQGAPSISTSVRDLDPAVDHVIARCLDPEPLKRPRSALAVAAALPGGDPLAAALEAGETPSPEMVAAAGSTDAMKPWLAVTCLAALAAGLVMLTWGRERSYLNTALPSDMGPEALAQQARNILAGLGYPKPSAQDWNFGDDIPRIMALARQDRKSLRARVAEARPPLIYFWYRSAPQRLVPWQFDKYTISEEDPPQVAAGSVTLRMDTEGRLSFLDAIPPDSAAGSTAAPFLSAGFEWKRLFDAAGLELGRFTPTTPVKTPPRAFDAQAAWTENGGAEPRSKPLRVEAAAWRGRAVWFTLSGETDSGSAPQQGDNAVWPALILAAAVLAVAWGWRNVRAGRADVRGAASLAILICACGLVGDLLQARHGFDAAEFHGLFRSLEDEVFGGIMIGAMYLALEPYVRRHWPHALIGWTRLWSGGWRDPLVGRHILIGLAAGSCFFSLLEWVPSGGGFSLAALDYAVRPSVVATRLVSGISGPIFLGCLTLMAIATLSRILRNRWLSALLISMLMVYALAQGSGWRSAVFFFVMYFAFSAFLLRLGLLAAISAFWMFFLSQLPLTLDTSTWYFYATPIAWAVVLAVGAWAFFTALAGQKLLAEED